MIRITKAIQLQIPKSLIYWVDLAADQKVNVIKYYAGSSKWLPINDDTDNDQSAKIAARTQVKQIRWKEKNYLVMTFDAYKTKLDGIAAQSK